MIDSGYNELMRGLLANAVILAGLLTPLGLMAQPRGAPHAFARSLGYYRSLPRAPRTQPLPRQARSAAPSASLGNFTFPPVTSSSLINSGQSACLLNPSFAGSFYCRQFYPDGPSLGIEPVYPNWFPSMGDEAEQPAPPVPEPEQDPQFAAQAGNPAAEVEMMREEQAVRNSRSAPSAESPMEAEEELLSTLLVYRDGHQIEVQGYAIQGKTLWVFSDQKTRRVPLADLDLAATQRTNGDRGVDFVVPELQ